MIDNRMKDIMADYLSDEEMEDMERMMNSSMEDYVVSALRQIEVKDKPQFIRADFSLIREVAMSDGADIISYTFENLTAGYQPIHINIMLDNDDLISKEIRLAGGQRIDGRFSLDREMLVSYKGRTVICDVKITDGIGRTVAAASDLVTVSEIKPPAMVTAETELIQCRNDGSKNYIIGKVRLLSSDTKQQCCNVKATTGNGFRCVKSVDLAPGATVELEVIISDIDLKTIGSEDVSLTVEIDGKRVTESRGRVIKSEMHGSGMKLTSKKLYAECEGQLVIDTNVQKDGKVFVGEVKVLNKGPAPETVSWILTMNGDSAEAKNMIVPASQTVKIPALIPAKMLTRDNTFTTTIRCQLSDSKAGLILDSSFTVNVRSRFDMDRSRMRELTAKSVDPHVEEIKKFVVSSDGQLAKAMGKSYEVSGYQRPEFIMKQLDAVYRAVRDYGMSYVSDIVAIEGEGNYQRVRDPTTVLKDHTGNCIELSILFASLLETMGFEPIIVFPKGHAIAGVILKTNFYPSRAESDPQMEASTIRVIQGERFADALFFETTMCADKRSSFTQAVASAHDRLSNEMESINSDRRFSIIKLDRGKN